MVWGLKKIQTLYNRKYPSKKQPSLSSVKRGFTRTGLTKPRKRRKHNVSGRIRHGIKSTHNNHIWTVDFKGWCQIRRGSKYEPLTIRDEYSRKILAIDILPNTRTEWVQDSFRKLFKKHGLPEYIRAELQSIGTDLSQESFDLWKDEYNGIRPHEALGMKSPDDVYEYSQRVFTLVDENKELDYGLMETRKVHKITGKLVYLEVHYLIGRALGDRSVGLKNVGKGILEVWFSDQQICYLNTNLEVIEPIGQSEKGADK